ncbi:MAG: hypothetical protein HXS43_06985 [Theionarchaea archaeon]|nr:hypothetical protein [Theionarchaea archaeon]
MIPLEYITGRFAVTPSEDHTEGNPVAKPAWGHSDQAARDKGVSCEKVRS